MTRFRTDLANGDIDWPLLFEVVADADVFAATRNSIYASGCLRTGYLERVASDIDFNAEVKIADLDRLRDLLTWIVRGDRFAPGVGDEAYRNGWLDALFEEMSNRVGVPHSSPLRR